jgi:hypothetical protein
MEHRIEIERAKRKDPKGRWIGQGIYATRWNGDLIGTWREPSCDAARWLLERFHAARDDTLVMCRDGKPALIGVVGQSSCSGRRFPDWTRTPRPRKALSRDAGHGKTGLGRYGWGMAAAGL